MFYRSELPPRTLKEMREGMIEFLSEENERIKREWSIQKQLRQSTSLS